MSGLKRFSVLLAAVTAVVVVSLAAAPAEIRLATEAPSGTTWHKALLDMGNSWKQNTGGRVALTVYPGGTQGDEATVIKKIRLDTLQASFVSVAGLAQLDDAFNVLAMPFFLENPDEEIAVEQKLTPVIEQRLQAKGFHLLAWGSGGWIELFSRKPLHTLADVKNTKLFTSKGSEKWLQWYVSNGFHPVALQLADIPQQLKLSTGLIDTAPYPPYAAMSLQIFRDAKYMLNVHIAPLTGALLISSTAWNRIAPEDRAKIAADARTFEQRVQKDAPVLDASSVKQMQERGLQVITLDAKAAGEFRAAAAQLAKTMRGSMVPPDIYDMAVQERDAFRKSHGR